MCEVAWEYILMCETIKFNGCDIVIMSSVVAEKSPACWVVACDLVLLGGGGRTT